MKAKFFETLDTEIWPFKYWFCFDDDTIGYDDIEYIRDKRINEYIRDMLSCKFSSIKFYTDDVTSHYNTSFCFNDVADEAFFQLSILNEEIDIGLKL